MHELDPWLFPFKIVREITHAEQTDDDDDDESRTEQTVSAAQSN